MQEKKCGNCRAFKRYYTKAFCEFMREHYGHCIEINKVVHDCEVCDCWKTGTGKRRKIMHTMVLNVLEKGLTNISALKQILLDNETIQPND